MSFAALSEPFADRVVGGTNFTTPLNGVCNDEKEPELAHGWPEAWYYDPEGALCVPLSKDEPISFRIMPTSRPRKSKKLGRVPTAKLDAILE